MDFHIIVVSIIQNTLMYSSPLIMGAMSALISERSGIISLGTEGMMSLGAFFAIFFCLKTSFSPILCFLFAGVFAVLISFIFMFFVLNLKADQTIAGISFNFIAPGLSLFLSTYFLGTVNPPGISFDKKVMKLFNNVFKEGSALDSLFNVSLIIYLSFIFVIILHFFLEKTRLGLRIKSCGEDPFTAQSLGIDVIRTRYIALIIAAFLAGLSGASYSMNVASAFSATLISGQGYISIAAMIFGQWQPVKAMFGALLFGFFTSLEIIFGGTDFSIPSPILAMLPYIMTILILIFLSKNSSSPKSLGKIF